MHKRNEEFFPFLFTLSFNFRMICFQTMFLSITFHLPSIFNKRKIGLKRGQHQLVLLVPKCFYIKNEQFQNKAFDQSHFWLLLETNILANFYCKTCIEIKCNKYWHIISTNLTEKNISTYFHFPEFWKMVLIMHLDLVSNAVLLIFINLYPFYMYLLRNHYIISTFILCCTLKLSGMVQPKR